MSETVAIVKCSNYDQRAVDNALNELLDYLGGISQYVKPGNLVLIKPNLLKATCVGDIPSTHFTVIKSIVDQVQSVGGKPIIGDSPTLGNVSTVARRSGLLEVADQMGIPIINWSTSVKVTPKPHYSMRSYKIAKEVIDADVVINVPKFKSHKQMQLTVAIKNLFGCVPGKLKSRLHLWCGKNRRTFGEMLVEYAELVDPQLTIVDGILAMEGPGPGLGSSYPLGILTGGTDVVALDRVHCEIVGLPAEEFDIIQAAREIGFGVADLNQIEILGHGLCDVAVSNFEFPPMIPVNFSPVRIVTSALKHFWAKQLA